MSKSTVYHCDTCGKAVDEGNGGTPPGIHVMLAQHRVDQSQRTTETAHNAFGHFTVTAPHYEPFPRLLVNPEEYDFCSRACLAAFVAQKYGTTS